MITDYGNGLTPLTAVSTTLSAWLARFRSDWLARFRSDWLARFRSDWLAEQRVLTPYPLELFEPAAD